MHKSIDELPGLKEDALRSLGACIICRKPQLGREITFYKVTVARAMFLRGAIEARLGLGMVLGGSDALARAMGPNADLAKIFDGPHEVFLHEECAARINHILELIPTAAAVETEESNVS